MISNTKQPLTFEEYLTHDDGTDSRYELIDGALIELPPESEFNNFIARYLLLAIVGSGIVPLRLVVNHSCEVQVPVLQLGDPQNRYPDLVVLREEHPTLTQKRFTIKLDMPPPRLVVEVVSPGKSNRERDYERKREQYCRVGIPEYWLVDPERQTVLVLQLENGEYVEVGQFRGSDLIVSIAFPGLKISAAEILKAGE